jgi:hypothetical protein
MRQRSANAAGVRQNQPAADVLRIGRWQFLLKQGFSSEKVVWTPLVEIFQHCYPSHVFRKHSAINARFSPFIRRATDDVGTCSVDTDDDRYSGRVGSGPLVDS